jgi:putative two-component system protein, hydrogenase maturation factor HypX/HoxX
MNKMRSYAWFIASFIERKLVRHNFGRSAMKIHLLTSAHNSLSQRLLVELTRRGHKVTVAIASSEEAMVKSVEDQAPDLIIAPMLTKRVPESIWSKHTCLIVHPGILGDRGPSSLDWAIAMGERTWACRSCNR